MGIITVEYHEMFNPLFFNTGSHLLLLNWFARFQRCIFEFDGENDSYSWASIWGSHSELDGTDNMFLFSVDLCSSSSRS